MEGSVRVTKMIGPLIEAMEKELESKRLNKGEVMDPCYCVKCNATVKDLHEEVERLKAENKQLQANQELWGNIELITAQRNEVKRLKAENKIQAKQIVDLSAVEGCTQIKNNKLREALERIRSKEDRLNHVTIADEALKNSS